MPHENDNVVVTVRLTKIFRDFWLREKVAAVCDLDMEVGRKEVFGLLGPNGSGKSTTLKMILGLMFPTKGAISVLGRGPNDVRTKERIGFLPEESYLYPFLDARETLDFYGRLFHIPRQQRTRRIDMLLDMVGLGSVAYRRVGEYSKGMQRRIGLAQALINDPDILILDEPTSGLDPLGIKQFKDLIRTLAGRGKTVILSTHLLGDAEDICDRVCILYGGRRQAYGRIDDLLARSLHTQLITDRLDERTIDAVLKVIRSSGRNLLEIGSPRDRLESLFISIIDDARRLKLDTGGAISGGAVAEFLRGQPEQEGRRVIEELVSAAAVKAAPVQQQQPAAQPAAQVSRDVLAGLMSDEKRDQQATVQQPGPKGKPADRQVDKKIIDDLLGKGPADPERK